MQTLLETFALLNVISIKVALLPRNVIGTSPRYRVTF